MRVSRSAWGLFFLHPPPSSAAGSGLFAKHELANVPDVVALQTVYDHGVCNVIVRRDHKRTSICHR